MPGEYIVLNQGAGVLEFMEGPLDSRYHGIICALRFGYQTE